MEDIKVNSRIKLSALWVSMMLLYIYADVLSLFRPGQVQEMLEGRMGPFPVTQASLLTASILMIIPALMVFLSLMLNAKVSRGVNILFGVLYTLVNISNLIGEAWVYYMVFGVMEILVTLFIIWHAWKWAKLEGGSDHKI
jgi:hypothetical protein